MLTTPAPRSVDLVILGAGISGLTAARRAAGRGFSVLVVEPADHVGGRSASHEVAGIRVDVGLRQLPTTLDADLLADLRELLGTDLQTHAHNGRLRVGDQWVRYPLPPAELAARLPRRLSLAAAREIALSRARPRHDSYAGALRSAFGGTLYETVFGPLARKLWGVDGEQLDGEQIRRQVKPPSPTRVARQLLRRRAGRPVDGGAGYLYPKRGFGQLAEALAEAATRDGAQLLTGAVVRTLHARPDGVRLVLDSGEVHAAELFSTLPLPELGRIARPAPSAQVVGDAAALAFRSVLVVYLEHLGRRWTRFGSHTLPDLTTPVARISEPANLRDGDDPTDRTVLCAEIPCTRADSLWEASDDELAQIVLAAARAAGLPAVRLGVVEVRRLSGVLPVYTRGYRDRLAGLDAWGDRLAHVTPFGRLGLFLNDDTQFALRIGWDAAECLRTGPDGPSLDHIAWAEARDRIRARVVDD
jgi:protoporphyrinogen oxidase